MPDIKCYRDGSRPCYSGCEAYVQEGIDVSLFLGKGSRKNTHCLELAAKVHLAGNLFKILNTMAEKMYGH